MSDEQLRKYFDFNEGDLFDNRNGYLSERQQKRLAADEAFWKKLSLIFGILLLVVAFLPVLIIGLKAAPCIADLCSEWPSSLRAFNLILIILITPTLLYFGLRVIRGALKPQKVFSVQKVEGPINIVKDKSYNSTSHMYTESHELHVGGEEFDEDEEVADIMMQGDIYAIYYIKESMTILSAELLASGK